MCNIARYIRHDLPLHKDVWHLYELEWALPILQGLKNMISFSIYKICLKERILQLQQELSTRCVTGKAQFHSFCINRIDGEICFYI